MLKKLFPCLFIVFLMGCASQWSLSTEQSRVALQWPDYPARGKVSYLLSMKGFEKGASAESFFNAIAYGRWVGKDYFGLPVAIAAGHDGRLAVADTGLKCVHLYIEEKKKYIALSKAGEQEFKSPVSVIFDDDLRLYISDSVIGRVFVFDKEGLFLFSFDGEGPVRLQRPTGLAFSHSNKFLYVVDTLANRVYAFNRDGRLELSFGDRGEEGGKFNYPTHIFWTPDRLLYVTDSMNFRIQIFDESGRFLNSFGVHGDMSGEIAMPKGVAVDKDGVAYVVDAIFDNVQLFNRKGKYLLTVGGRGTNPGEFWLPSGIFIDESAKLYVCDSYNRRVQVFKIMDNNNGKD